MQTQLSVATPEDSIGYPASRKRNEEAPFKYVVLDGSSAGSSKLNGDDSLPKRSLETDFFVARVELAAPRWSNAREALVKALAVDEGVSLEPAGFKSETPVRPEAGAKLPTIAVKKQPPALGLKPGVNSKAPRAINFQSPPPPQVGQKIKSNEEILPILQDGTMPLLPLSVPLAVSAQSQLNNADLATAIPSAKFTQKPKSRREIAVKAGAFCFLLIASVSFFELQKTYLPVLSDWSIGNTDLSLDSSAALIASQAGQTVAGKSGGVPAQGMTADSVASVSAHEDFKFEEKAIPSGAFVNLVAGLRVSGVTHGSVERALINGRLVNLGDLIDPNLEVRLIEVDGTSRNLVFEDRSSARITLRF